MSTADLVNGIEHAVDAWDWATAAIYAEDLARIAETEHEERIADAALEWAESWTHALSLHPALKLRDALDEELPDDTLKTDWGRRLEAPGLVDALRDANRQLALDNAAWNQRMEATWARVARSDRARGAYHSAVHAQQAARFSHECAARWLAVVVAS